MMFKEIVELVKGRTGFTTPQIQPGHRVPSAPDRCILISEASGGETFGELPDQANIYIMIVTRAETYFQARDDAWTIYQSLHGTGGWEMPNIDDPSGPNFIAMTIDALTTPQNIGQDENGRYEFSTNFVFRMAQGSCGGA